MPRNRAWADQRYSTTVLAVTGLSLVNLLQNAPTVDTLTAVRVVGDLTIDFDSTSTPSDQLNIIDIGIGVTSAEAFAVVAGAAVPNPSAEDEYPPRGWIYANTQAVVSQGQGGDSGAYYRPAVFKFDLRSMRKVDKGVLFAFIQSSAGKGTGISTLISGRIRTLCLT